MPIALYGFQLWYFKETSLFYSLKELKRYNTKWHYRLQMSFISHLCGDLILSLALFLSIYISTKSVEDIILEL